MNWKRTLLIGSALIMLIAVPASLWLFQEIEYLRIDSPERYHTAIVTYRRYHSLLPNSPGQSGDIPGYIRIVDTSGADFGKVALPMVSMSRDLEWTEGGASLKLIYDWSF